MDLFELFSKGEVNKSEWTDLFDLCFVFILYSPAAVKPVPVWFCLFWLFRGVGHNIMGKRSEKW